MNLGFDLLTELTPEEVFGYFKGPHDWPRLFTALDRASDGKGRWLKVPIRRSPFALTAQITTAAPNVEATWDLRGFWNGWGEVLV